MESSAVAAPRTMKQLLKHGEAVDTVIMSAVALRRRARETVRLVLKAFRELDEELNKLAAARDKEAESHAD